MTVLNRLGASLLGLLLWDALAAPPATADADPVGVWPLRPPVVAQGFDPPDTPYGAGHRGVDLLGRPGQTVRTALAGTVTYAGLLAGRGVVVVAHGATRTTYQPVSATASVGDTVPAGAPIGLLQQSGSHCLPRTCLPCRYYIRRAAACAGFVLRAAAYFATHGITRIERVITPPLVVSHPTAAAMSTPTPIHPGTRTATTQAFQPHST